MAQILHTKYYGDVQVDRSYANGSQHIARLRNGAYAHIGGLPVTNRQDLIRMVPEGPELEEALDWFDNRDKRAAEAATAQARLVLFYPLDQSWRYVDTMAPVSAIEDLYEALKGSTALEGALAWFFRSRKGAVLGTNAESEQARASGDGIDERLLRGLAESRTEGMTLHELSKQLGMEPKALVDLIKSLEESDLVERQQKRFYLPAYAPKLPGQSPATVTVGAGDDGDDGEEG